MTLTRQQLLRDLYAAYYDARRGKGKMSYIVKWEADLKANMEQLCDDLISRRYVAQPSKCFIVDYPKKREIFAAMFRDRIVHHLYYNYTHRLYERTFIQHSYSCVPGRGTHYGIRRVTDMLRRESHNWQRPCYVMHLDIRGYFMHIVRKKLLKIASASLKKMASHRISRHSGERWSDRIDINFLCWLTAEIVLLNPKENCIIVGSPDGWVDLDPAKSLLKTEDGLGLPIGNLTSQLFSNVYLNVFDHFMKRVLLCKNYGRYVDDSVVVSADKEWLLSLAPRIRRFLYQELGLELHMGKLEISEVHRGVEFLGVFIKPWRTYVSNHTLQRIRKNIFYLTHQSLRPKWVSMSRPTNSLAGGRTTADKILRTVSSYLGIFSHTASYRLRRKLFFRVEFMRLGVFSEDMTKITERHQYFINLLKRQDYEQNEWKKERLLARSRRKLAYRHRLRPEEDYRKEPV